MIGHRFCNFFRGGNVAAPIPGPAATAFLARTSGLSTTERNAYINLINGLVADGTWTKFDALYVLATNTPATAKLNLVSTNFPLTYNGTPPEASQFTADVGYAGDGSTVFLGTGYIPLVNGVNYLPDGSSASMGACSPTNRVVSDSSVIMGIGDPGSFSYIVLLQTSLFFYEMNSVNFPSVANASTRGAWINSRTGPNAQAAYLNGSPAPISTTANAAAPAPNGAVYLLALDNGGTTGNWTTDKLSIAFIGGGFTGAEAASVNGRFNTYLTAVGSPVF